MKWGSGSLSSSSSPPLLTLLFFFPSSPFVPPFFLLTPDTANSFPPPLYLLPSFQFFFFLCYFSSPFIILWVFCPSTHSFPLFNQYTYSNFLLLLLHSFPQLSATIIDVSFKLLFPVKWKDTEMLEHFTPKMGNLLNFWELQGFSGPQSSFTLYPSVFCLDIPRHFSLFASIFLCLVLLIINLVISILCIKSLRAKTVTQEWDTVLTGVYIYIYTHTDICIYKISVFWCYLRRWTQCNQIKCCIQFISAFSFPSFLPISSFLPFFPFFFISPLPSPPPFFKYNTQPSSVEIQVNAAIQKTDWPASRIATKWHLWAFHSLVLCHDSAQCPMWSILLPVWSKE